MKIASIQKIVMAFTVVMATMSLHAQTRQDTIAIREILDEEVASWNRGDAHTYSRHFATDTTFTNILGMFYIGHKNFFERHDQIFKGVFNKTVLNQRVVSLKFLGPNVAIVETLTWISAFSKAGPPPAPNLMQRVGSLPGLCRVMAKDGKRWKIVTYHNIDVKPAVAISEIK